MKFGLLFEEDTEVEAKRWTLRVAEVSCLSQIIVEKAGARECNVWHGLAQLFLEGFRLISHVCSEGWVRG